MGKNKGYDSIVIELQAGDRSLASVSLKRSDVEALEGRGLSMRDHIYNIVEVLLESIDEKADPAGPPADITAAREAVAKELGEDGFFSADYVSKHFLGRAEEADGGDAGK